MRLQRKGRVPKEGSLASKATSSNALEIPRAMSKDSPWSRSVVIYSRANHQYNKPYITYTGDLRGAYNGRGA